MYPTFFASGCCIYKFLFPDAPSEIVNSEKCNPIIPQHLEANISEVLISDVAQSKDTFFKRQLFSGFAFSARRKKIVNVRQDDFVKMHFRRLPCVDYLPEIVLHEDCI